MNVRLARVAVHPDRYTVYLSGNGTLRRDAHEGTRRL